MSPMIKEMPVREVVPRLRNAAPSIPKVGHEEDEEITQDATLMAAWMMESAEKTGHPISNERIGLRHTTDSILSLSL